MSDLRVTDVQAALRHFSDIGHDVLTDPRALHLDGNRYGMAVGHTLGILPQRRGPMHYLDSELLQSERPLVSHVQTLRLQHDAEGMEGLSRIVNARTPHTNLNRTPKDKETIPREDLYRADSTSEYVENSYLPKGISPLWTPGTDSVSPFSSAHETLKAHTSPEFEPRRHTVLDFGPLNDTRSQWMKTGGGSPGIPGLHSNSSSNLKFSHPEALQRLVTPHKPFSGLINVEHSASGLAKDLHNYTYNPDTEELHKH